MKSQLLLAALAATTLTVTACGGQDMNGSNGGSGGGSGTLQACAVHLFDGDNFDASDDNDIIKGPGDFANLKNLPGAQVKDWNAEADSIKIGSGATVQLWSQENFQGDTKTYQPGGQDASVMEFRSMKIEC